MVAALMLVLGLAAGALMASVTYIHELRRIARFLGSRDAASNARVTLGAPAPGLTQLADAINEELDHATADRIATQRHAQEFQRDLSALSHDIRTPLMGAKGYLQLALDETDARARDGHLTAALARIDGTSDLLEQLFSYTKADDPDLVLELDTVDVASLVESILLAHFPDFEQRGWEPQVTTTGAARIQADRTACTRIVENLVVNALRYGNGAPRITLGPTASDPKALLCIENPVADPADIEPERLFDRFYRSDPARRDGGAGLGLATAAKLAERMGLTLRARMEGDRLSITLAAKR